MRVHMLQRLGAGILATPFACCLAFGGLEATAQAEEVQTSHFYPEPGTVPAFLLTLENQESPQPVEDLHLDVVGVSGAETVSSDGRLGNLHMVVRLSFSSGEEEWAVFPDECMTPAVFGTGFSREGYDKEKDLVCVVVGDGGNIGLKPSFDDAGKIASIDVLFHLAGADGEGYSGLRVDDGPEAYLTNPETMEPRFNELVPVDPPLVGKVKFVRLEE